jgi:branched-chain amino acid transport system substrate-binding protein
MKAAPTSDPVFGPGRIREDGRALFPAYLLQAKAPKEIRSQWDVLKLVATTPADQAWRPLSEGGCPMIRS